MLRMSYKNGEYILSGLTQDHINAMSYALDVAEENSDTYDIEHHDDLQEFIGRLWDEDYADMEDVPEEYDGYLTGASVRDTDEQDTVINFQEALRKDRVAHGEGEDYY